jgi:hypothetical protein
MFNESEKDLAIVEFIDADDAVKFAKEQWPDRDNWKQILSERQGNEPWIIVCGLCDICNNEMMFFAPAEIYKDDIGGVECSVCNNMSVYPKEMEED